MTLDNNLILHSNHHYHQNHALILHQMSHNDLLFLYKPILAITNLVAIQFPIRNPQRYIVTSIFMVAVYILIIFKAEETVSPMYLLPKHIAIAQHDRFRLYNYIFMLIHILVFFYSKSANILKVLNSLRTFDEVFVSVITFSNIKRAIFASVAFFIMIITLCSLRIYGFYCIKKELYLHLIQYTFVIYLQYNIILHYTYFLLHLHYRFFLLNHYLANFRTSNAVLLKRTLHLVKILHEHLMGIAQEINGIFGVYFTHMIVVTCTEQVMVCFYMFLLVKEKGLFGWASLDLLLEWFHRICFHMFFVFGLAHKVEAEVRNDNFLNVRILSLSTY